MLPETSPDGVTELSRQTEEGGQVQEGSKSLGWCTDIPNTHLNIYSFAVLARFG